LKSVRLANDLEVNAYGIAVLAPEDLFPLNLGESHASGNRALISAGTGLGEAGLFVRLEQRQVLGSTHLNGNRAEGIDNRGSKRHEGQSRWYFGVEYVVFTLGRRHPVPL
jgi:hypothetical protein